VVSARQLPLLEQHVWQDFIEGHLERHIRQMRMLCRPKRRQVLVALNIPRETGNHLGENAGIHLMVQLHKL